MQAASAPWWTRWNTGALKRRPGPRVKRVRAWSMNRRAPWIVTTAAYWVALTPARARVEWNTIVESEARMPTRNETERLSSRDWW